MTKYPSATRVLTVNAKERQYRIQATVDYDQPWPASEDGLTTGEDSWTAVITGTQWGPVTIGVQVLGEAPLRLEEGWDMVVERDIVSEAGGLEIIELFDTGGASIRASAGRLRLRIHVHNRAGAAPHGYLDTALESHLIQIWPSDEPQPPAMLVGPDEFATRYQ
jgi:hypothetical protein